MMQQMAQIALSNLITKNMTNNQLILNQDEIIKLLKDLIGDSLTYNLDTYEYSVTLRITKSE